MSVYIQNEFNSTFKQYFSTLAIDNSGHYWTVLFIDVFLTGDVGGQNGQTDSHYCWIGRNVLLCCGHDSGPGFSGMICIFSFKRQQNNNKNAENSSRCVFA